MRGIEDTAFTGVVSISTTLGRYFLKGDLSLTSIAGSRRRMVFSVEGETIEVKCLVFMGSSFRRRRKDVCGGLQLRGATEWMNPEHLFSSGVVSVRCGCIRASLLMDRQGALAERPRPRKVALIVKQQGEGVEGRRRIEMIGVEHLLMDR